MWSKKEIPLWKVFIIRLSVVLLMLIVSRWLLFIFNTDNFPGLTIREQFRLFFVGIRFDLWPLIVGNLPLLILLGLPFRFKFNKIYCKVIDILYVFVNWLAISVNLVDVIYYRYIDKRMTSELTEFFKETDDNQGSMMMHFIHDFWFIALFIILTAVILIFIVKKTQVKKGPVTNVKRWYLTRSIIFLNIVFWGVIGIRGGFQTCPITIITAASYTNTQNMVLILNTPFTICLGSSGETLEKIDYFDENEIDYLYSPIQKDLKINRFIDGDAKGFNVFLLILESHGQEMLSYYNERRTESLTPFLDSLLSQSLTFNGMANGRRSIDALTSTLSGLPSMMVTDYASSRYAANHLDGWGTTLKKHGYSTAFFHGGNNGSMSFDASAVSAGFDKYYGRNEYNNDNDYDGTWGIYDMPYLQYTALILNEMPKPFAAGVFTLSSHHPYSLPTDYTLPEGNYNTPFEKTMRYADDAMQKFFETVSKYDWFDSTIFVILGDHVNPEHPFEEYLNGYGQFQIPIAFYAPKIIKPLKTNIMAQQTDLGVSILAALNYSDTTFSFGRNLFDSIQQPNFTSYLNNIYQYCDGKYMLQSDGESIIAVFDIINDPQLGNNLYVEGDEERWKEIFTNFKLHLQQYNNRMINNTLYIK